jgi:hypothetical protein
MARSTPVVLELGRRRTFATAVDWPGWCRSGQGEEGALQALAAYEQRHSEVAQAAGATFPTRPPALVVVERVEGNATTDFGAPGVVSMHDAAPLTAAQARRTAALVEAAWRSWDQVAAAAPAVLSRPGDGAAAVANGWPPRYAAHRIAWHALDHAWEIEDRSVSGV